MIIYNFDRLEFKSHLFNLFLYYYYLKYLPSSIIIFALLARRLEAPAHARVQHGAEGIWGIYGGAGKPSQGGAFGGKCPLQTFPEPELSHARYLLKCGSQLCSFM